MMNDETEEFVVRRDFPDNIPFKCSGCRMRLLPGERAVDNKTRGYFYHKDCWDKIQS